MSRPPKRSTSQDRELWDEWAKSITPITTGKPRVRIGETSADKPAPADPAGAPGNKTPTQPAAANTSSKNIGRTAAATAKSTSQSRSSLPRRVPGLAQFDHKSRRRISAGRIEIAARIDLHGMRRHEAHAALRGFLHSAHERGLRWVLVITGKGAPTSANDTQDDDIWPGETARGRGILRQSLPQWLAEPEFRAVVVSHTAAAPHHGGEGAQYIQLRTRRTHR